MKTRPPPDRGPAASGLFSSFLAACLLCPGTGFAQAAGSDAPTETATAGAGRVVKLDPFEVQADSDTSYGATNSNSITAFNTSLAKLPISADIFDKAFMNDTGSTSVEQMIETYSAGAGYAGADAGNVAMGNQPGDRNGNSFLQLRGLSTPSIERDGFMTNSATGNGITSNFDIERVEIINGPQALLYGVGGGGGVINLVSKEARLGAPAFGSVLFRVDQFGNKTAQFDVGEGNNNVALRLTVMNQEVGARRQNIGGPMEGYYAQLAFRLLGKTIVRLSAEQTTFSRLNQNNIALQTGSTTTDLRDDQNLQYLVATNQIQATANGGPSLAGPIVNGLVNWINVDSFAGWYQSETTTNEFENLTADTQWNPWLSTRFSVGYDNFQNDRINDTVQLYSPSYTADNPLGVWAMGQRGSAPAATNPTPARTKAIRFSALATNDFLGGRVHSQSILGADFQRVDSFSFQYEYFQADSNWNVITTPGVSNDGRTLMGVLEWPVSNGPVEYPFFLPTTPRVTVNGINYVRQIQNEVNPALISPADPLGVTLGGQGYGVTKNIVKGVYGANFSQWLDGRLDTMAGFRAEDTFAEVENQGAAPPAPPATAKLATSGTVGFNLGVDYRLTKWLSPYVTVSDSFDPPSNNQPDPYGKLPKTARAIGEEIGLKLANPTGTVSGSVAFYHTSSKNEQYETTGTLENDINPSGLNGAYNAPSIWINVDRQSEGVQAVLSLAPIPNWRMRLSAAVINGTIENTTSYGQLYNDQFHENSQGQVTFADGTVVYVPPTYNSKTLTEPSTTAGAIPLTVTAMSTSGNAYFANPVAVNGQISSTANVANVLRSTDPVHGAILTGATGLPISDLQINPGFTPPGTIVTSAAGDATTGYPEVSANLTSVYTFTSGWAKGFNVGGTMIAGWFNRSYYYYASGVSSTPNGRILFDNPTLARFDLIGGYTRRFGRVIWKCQLNAYNLFNHYNVVFLPNEINGWAGPNNATLNQQPRSYVLTNTLSF